MPSRPLRGARYLQPDSAFTDLPAYITEVLPTLDLKRTLDFYESFRQADPTPSDHALLACNDLFYLFTILCNRRDAHHHWLFDRVREVENAPNGHLDLWARGHYKSSIITFALTIQDIVIDPEVTIGIFSYSRGTAQKFLSQIKTELEKNENLKTCFPDVLFWDPEREADRWSLDKGIVVKRLGNPKEATVEAWGLVEGQPTGVHFKVLVFDDMIEQRNVTNPEQVQKATEAWELADNLGVGPGTIHRYVGTRYALGDTYQTMIDRGAVKVRLKPATHNGRIDGKPVFWDEKTWEEKKVKQRSTLPAQLLQNPAAGKQSVFDLEWMRPYEIRPTTLNVYIMGDPSRGRTVRSDRTAIAVVGIDSAGNKYLLDGARHRMKLSQRWEMLRMLYAKWSNEYGVQSVRVGYERFGQQTDDEYFQEKMRSLPDGEEPFTIEELAWPNEGKNSKADRVQRLQPDFEGEKFFLPPVIHHPEHGLCYWKYDGFDPKRPQEEQNPSLLIKYWPYTNPTRLQRLMEAQGQKYRIPQAIRRRDEDGNIYDVTYALIEEMRLFPFATHDDLVDATSRIYDMSPAPATLMDRIIANPHDYADA
jgi:hypothetical protein